jgi:tetratricopeptide (TPR) repeat protein
MGRRDDAEAYSRRALEKFELQRDLRGQADALMSLAAIALGRGDHERTEAAARMAIPLFEQVGARFGVASARNQIGDALRSQGKLEAAEQAFAEAEVALAELGSPDRYVPLVNLGLVLLARGRFAEAADRLAVALAQMQLAGRKGIEGAIHAFLLPVAADAGDWQRFAEHARLAEELLGGSGFVHTDIATAAEQAGELAEGAAALPEADVAWELARGQWASLRQTDRMARAEDRLRSVRSRRLENGHRP